MSSLGQLTPFVRSDAVGAVLAETLGHPERELTLSDLSRQSGISLPVVHREVNRLVEAGVLSDRTEGRNRLVRADPEHPLYDLMHELIETTYGPVPVLRETFGDIDGVEEVLIFGSWAARRAGEPGAFPRDIDALIVGSATRRALAAAAALASDRLGIPVNITRLSRSEWESEAPTPFVQNVRNRPLVNAVTGQIRA